MFRELLYTLLGLVMNLCLQPALVSEVRRSRLPTWDPGTTWTRPVAHSCSHLHKGNSSPGSGWGKPGHTLSLLHGGADQAPGQVFIQEPEWPAFA